MLDELYMQDLANAMRMPEEVVPAGKVTVSGPEPEMAATADMPQTGVRVGRAGISPEQSAKAGGLDRPLVALLDTLAGALQGATAQTLGLPGDIRSILDMINKEGAQKYLGDPVMPTTKQMQEILPAVVPQGVANQADREFTAKMASEVGTFLPAPGVPEAAIQGVKAVGKAIKATKNMPVGMSTQAVGQGMDELGFYSAAKQAVDAIQQPKGTGAQFLAQISKTPGVKPDEIKWTGLDEFLQSKKSVTKAEVQEYLDKNRVQIKEVTLSNPLTSAEQAEIKALRQKDRMNVSDRARFDALFEKENSGNRPKFSNYTLPGGENYREILLQLDRSADLTPKANAVEVINKKLLSRNYGTLDEDQVAILNTGGTPAVQMLGNMQTRLDMDLGIDDIFENNKNTFSFGHFDQPNILAHLRVNDRVIDGKKTLFVEEVQSDWHQAGRKKGYQSKDIESQLKASEERMAKRGQEIRGLSNRMAALDDSQLDEFNALAVERQRLQDLQGEETDLGNRLYDSRSEGVPDAPFKTTWSDLSMKRVIQMASEGGYDRIAFTTGKTQTERFDLSKQINEVYYKKNSDGTYKVEAVGKDSRTYLGENYSPEQLEENIGKELTKKIVEDQGKNIERSDLKSLSGVDLQVGGEGMKGFYDDILPKFLDKYAKKWDAKTGMTSLTTDDIKFQEFYNWALKKDKSKSYNSIQSSFKKKDNLYKDFAAESPIKGDEVHYIDVTPKMRESVVTKGQPMFAIGAGGAGAAATQEENK